jgi:hypothetical protein
LKDYTLLEASRALGVSGKMLRGLVHNDLVPYVQLPGGGSRRGRVRFTPEQIAQIKASWLREPVQNGTEN